MTKNYYTLHHFIIKKFEFEPSRHAVKSEKGETKKKTKHVLKKTKMSVFERRDDIFEKIIAFCRRYARYVVQTGGQ